MYNFEDLLNSTLDQCIAIDFDEIEFNYSSEAVILASRCIMHKNKTLLQSLAELGGQVFLVTGDLAQS